MYAIWILTALFFFIGGDLAHAKSAPACDAACEEGRAAIIELVEKFEEHEDYHTSKAFNEAALRIDFIDKFFEILGWDVTNQKKVFLYLQDTVPETRLRMGPVVR